LDGQLGLMADPSNPQEIRTAIKEAFHRPRGVQRELEYFSLERFVERWHALLDENLLLPSSQRRGVCAERSEGADGVARSASPIGRSLSERSAEAFSPPLLCEEGNANSQLREITACALSSSIGQLALISDEITLLTYSSS